MPPDWPKKWQKDKKTKQNKKQDLGNKNKKKKTKIWETQKGFCAQDPNRALLAYIEGLNRTKKRRREDLPPAYLPAEL